MLKRREPSAGSCKTPEETAKRKEKAPKICTKNID
jgi:hypothetical protein